MESLDKLNTSSDYYNDICYISTSDSGTDIILKDRKEEFIKGNKTVCQEGCDFSDYDYQNKKAQCSCDVKESSSSYADMIIDKDKLFKNFMDIKNIANINLLKCYKSLFSKKGIQHNIGSFIIIPIIIFHLISIFIFYKYQFNKIEEKINDIIFGIKNWKLFKESKKNERRKRRLDKLKMKKINQNKEKLKNSEEQLFNQIIPADNYKNKKIKLLKRNKIIKNNTELPKQNNPQIKINDSNSNPPKRIKKKNKKSKNIVVNNAMNLNNKNIHNIISENTYNDNNDNESNNNKKIIQKTKEIMAYNEQELNELKYRLALKYDKRNYCEYYLSLIKTKHILIFSFYYSQDYNSKIIKMDLFFIGFVIYFTVNALFFNDNTMHKIYEDHGKFQIIYQLPQIIYSSIISTILNALLKILALSEDAILNFKHNKNIEGLNERIKELNKRLQIKFILFFVISTIFILIFWYYLSMFCAIYINTQIHLIKDTLISFGLSLLYPIIIYLFPGIFRIPALADKENEKPCMYKFSTILQMI